MKREQLRELGLTDDQINTIMAENGKDINNAKADVEKINAELEQTKKDLATANETLDKFKDYDNVKADVEKYKAEAEQSKAEYTKKLADMELEGKIKDFTGGKKFVNDLTRDAINSQLKGLVNDEANKGKSLEELLNGLTKDKPNIFVDENAPKAPVVPNMKGAGGEESGIEAAFKRLNPNIKL